MLRAKVTNLRSSFSMRNHFLAQSIHPQGFLLSCMLHDAISSFRIPLFIVLILVVLQLQPIPKGISINHCVSSFPRRALHHHGVLTPSVLLEVNPSTIPFSVLHKVKILLSGYIYAILTTL